jgi:hypothetical protein
MSLDDDEDLLRFMTNVHLVRQRSSLFKVPAPPARSASHKSKLGGIDEAADAGDSAHLEHLRELFDAIDVDKSASRLVTASCAKGCSRIGPRTYFFRKDYTFALMQMERSTRQSSHCYFAECTSHRVRCALPCVCARAVPSQASGRVAVREPHQFECACTL